MDDDVKIADLQRKIKREREIMDATTRVLQAHNRQAPVDPSVTQGIDRQVKESENNIKWFEEQLYNIQQRRMNDGIQQMNIAPYPIKSSGPSPTSAQRQDNPYQQTMFSAFAGDSSVSAYGDAGNYSDLDNDQGMPLTGPFGPPPPDSPSRSAKPRPTYSRLGIL